MSHLLRLGLGVEREAAGPLSESEMRPRDGVGLMSPTTPAQQRRATRAAIRGRVACALAKPLTGDERPDVLRWFGGLRRLDGLVLPLGVVERDGLDDEAA